MSLLHNAVHLGFGVVGLSIARTVAGARGYLLGGGAVAIVLGAYGSLVDYGSVANLLPANTAGNWLHFVLGAVMVVSGLVVPGRAHVVTRAGTPPARRGPPVACRGEGGGRGGRTGSD
ncbi:DUF4383 domain-containing protein [Actinokineospora pegani]|uniref:DUF4383 domain-containing protein n=1 Tax=Actinokineospora pegani TaxID=2654637 RepID=UPI001F485C86|nr:DUF4383 domain-containing protein [Actinokineospora pegani]